MPFRDKTGPQGKGPMTGRGFGPCNDSVDGRRGPGMGRGMGFGRGRGFKSQFSSPTKDEKKDELEKYKNELEKELESVKAEQKKLDDVK